MEPRDTDLEDPLFTAVLPDLCLVEDLAVRLRMSESAVRTHLRSGAIPGRKIGRRWVVDREALLRTLAPGCELPPLRVVD